MFISLYVTFSAMCDLSSNFDDDGYDARDMETVHTEGGYKIHPDSYEYVTRDGRVAESEFRHVVSGVGQQMVIDFVNVISVVNITFTFLGRGESPLECPVNIMVSIMSNLDPAYRCFRREATPTEASYDCHGSFARKMVILSRCSPSIKSIFAFDTFLENYEGCFQTIETLLDIDEITGTTFGRHDPKSCALRCHGRSKYLGLNSEEKCYCIDTLDGLIYIKLALCKEGCRRRKHFCGREKKHLSIYLTRNANKVFRRSRVAWDCFTYSGCLNCITGLFGFNCEFRNCSIDNGQCPDLCSNFRVEKLDLGVCRKCGDGTIHYGHLDNCPDFNECETPNICSGRSCFNTLGSFECLCYPGFTKDRLGNCKDIDECNENKCDRLSTLCNNDVGSFTCNCLSGFKPSFSKISCEDIDECGSIGRKCPDGVPCINSIGSYDCLCPKGTNKRKFFHATECDDIDECEIPDLCNLTSSFCINTIPFYVCGCRPGYVSVDNFTCEPKNVSHTEQTTLPSTTEFSSEDDLEIYYIYLGIGFVFILILLILAICTYFCCKQSVKSISLNDSTLASGTISSAER